MRALFLSVQLTIMLAAFLSEERFRIHQTIGYCIAIGGLVYLFWLGELVPNLLGSALMAISGIAWGMYSIRGRIVRDPFAMTVGNFGYAIPMSFLAAAVGIPWTYFNWEGVMLAVISGVFASALGCVIWYRVLESLSKSQASLVHLLVLVLVAAGGILFLGENVSLRLSVACTLIIGGVALALVKKAT